MGNIKTGLSRMIGIGAALLMAGSVWADGRQDFYHQLNQTQFFNNAQNARTFGMAGSSVATSSDSSSVLGNPAGLGFMRMGEFSGSYSYNQITGNDLLTNEGVDADLHEGHLLGALPIQPYKDALPEYGNMGFGIGGFVTNSDDSLDFEPRRWALDLAYAKAIADDLSLGYSINYIYHTSDTAGADMTMDDGIRQAVGLQYKASKDTTIGFDTFYGFGQGDIEYNDGTEAENDMSSWGAEAGIGQMIGATLVAFSTDYTGYWQDQDSDSYAWGFRLGAEHPVLDWMKARIGYRYQANMDYDLTGDDNDNAKFNGISFGAGFALGDYGTLDYGAEYRAIGDGDWTHMLSYVLPVDLCM